MKYFFLLLFFIFVSCGDEVNDLRKEIQLLREVIAIQNEQLLGYKGSVAKPAAAAVTVTPTGTPTWSVSSYTSTYKTIVTVPVSTEVPITLHGREITTTIVDYETKETVTSSILPTSVLVYPTAIGQDGGPPVHIEPTQIAATPSIKADPAVATTANAFSETKPASISSPFGSKSQGSSNSRLSLHKPDSRPSFSSPLTSNSRHTSSSRGSSSKTSSRSSSNRPNLSFGKVSSRSSSSSRSSGPRGSSRAPSRASSRPSARGSSRGRGPPAAAAAAAPAQPKSFSLSSSPFGGFKSSFSRFKRQTVEPFDIGNYVELRSSME